jgi:hypothetical protein
MQRNSRLATLGGGALLVGVSLTFGSQDVTAADHLDSPATQLDASVDLADVYAFATEDGSNVVLAFTYGGPITDGTEVYNANALYTFHIDEDGDGVSDQQIYVRFGQNGLDEWGVQFEGVPGSPDAFNGAVGGEVGDGTHRAQAGMFDDPFFFDFAGFQATSAALGDDGDPVDLLFGDIGGTPPDFFAGANEMGIVVQFPTADLGVTAFSMWVTASAIEDGGETTGG